MNQGMNQGVHKIQSEMIQAVMPPHHESVSQRKEETRTKRIVNVRLLIETLFVGFIATLLSFVWYSYRTKHVAKIFEERAASLEKDGKWREAAAYLDRYLQLEPDDLDTRVRLVQAAEHSLDGP